MSADAEKLAKAKQFADRMEAQMRKLGASGDYFCTEQHKRWREHSIRAYMGVPSVPVTSDSKKPQS